MNLYLHIGNHKTGSTAIQSLLENNTETLNRTDFIYPQTGRLKGAHHGIVRHLKKETEKHFDDFVGKKTERKDFELLLKNLQEECAEYCNIIISSEEFFNCNSLDSIRVHEFISLFENVTVIVYLRNQIDHIESSYKFSIAWDKEMENRTFDEYLEFQLNSEYHEYLPTLEYWSGIQNTLVKCVSFDENKSQLFKSFLSLIDRIEINNLVDLSKISRNKSPSTFETAVLREFKGRKNLDTIKALLNKLTADSEGQINTLYTFEQYVKIRDKFKTSNELLHEKYGINLNKYVPDPRKKFFVNQSAIDKIQTLQDLIIIMLR